MEMLQALWALIPWLTIAKGAAVGAGGAALFDLGAFRSWKTWDDAVKYEWSVASWRWFQGAILGILGALGVGLVT